MLHQQIVRLHFLEYGVTYPGEDSLQYHCKVADTLTEEQKSTAVLRPDKFLGLVVQVNKFYHPGAIDVETERITLSELLNVRADKLLRDAPIYEVYLLGQQIEGGAVVFTPTTAKVLYQPSVLGPNACPEAVKAVSSELSPRTSMYSRIVLRASSWCTLLVIRAADWMHMLREVHTSV